MKKAFDKVGLGNTFEVINDERELKRIIILCGVGGLAHLFGWLWLQGTIGFGLLYLLSMASVGDMYVRYYKSKNRLWLNNGSLLVSFTLGWVLWLIVGGII